MADFFFLDGRENLVMRHVGGKGEKFYRILGGWVSGSLDKQTYRLATKEGRNEGRLECGKYITNINWQTDR